MYRYTYVKVKRADKARKAGDEARDGVPGVWETRVPSKRFRVREVSSESCNRLVARNNGFTNNSDGACTGAWTITELTIVRYWSSAIVGYFRFVLQVNRGAIATRYLCG